MGLFFLTAGALLGLLVLSALIPRSAIRDRMRASAAYLRSGEQFPMELRGVQASRIAGMQTAKPTTGADGVTAEGCAGDYDGASHAITVTAPDGAVVTYGESETGTYAAANPSYTDAGTYTAHYTLTRTGHSDGTAAGRPRPCGDGYFFSYYVRLLS